MLLSIEISSILMSSFVLNCKSNTDNLIILVKDPVLEMTKISNKSVWRRGSSSIYGSLET